MRKQVSNSYCAEELRQRLSTRSLEAPSQEDFPSPTYNFEMSLRLKAKNI